MAIWKDEMVSVDWDALRDVGITDSFIRQNLLCSWEHSASGGENTYHVDIEQYTPSFVNAAPTPHTEDEVEQILATIDRNTGGSFTTAANPLPMSIELSPNGYTPSVSLCGTDHIMRIYDADGNLLVDVDDNGILDFGHGYDPKKAAVAFWQALADTFPGVVQQPVEEARVTDWSHYEISLVTNPEPWATIKEENAEEAYERAMRFIE